jgi:hypothetical protein
MANRETKKFLTYEQLDSLIASGVSVTLADNGRILTVWASANHGSIYAWNGLAQSFQFIGGAFKS